jgi:hypothetical protein
MKKQRSKILVMLFVVVGMIVVCLRSDALSL